MKKYHVLLIAAMATLGLSACDKSGSPADEGVTPAMEESSMMDTVEDASEDAMDTIEETIEEAIDDASDSMDEMMEDMSDSAEEDLSDSVDNMMDK